MRNTNTPANVIRQFDLIFRVWLHWYTVQHLHISTLIDCQLESGSGGLLFDWH